MTGALRSSTEEEVSLQIKAYRWNQIQFYTCSCCSACWSWCLFVCTKCSSQLHNVFAHYCLCSGQHPSWTETHKSVWICEARPDTHSHPSSCVSTVSHLCRYLQFTAASWSSFHPGLFFLIFFHRGMMGDLICVCGFQHVPLCTSGCVHQRGKPSRQCCWRWGWGAPWWAAVAERPALIKDPPKKEEEGAAQHQEERQKVKQVLQNQELCSKDQHLLSSRREVSKSCFFLGSVPWWLCCCRWAFTKGFSVTRCIHSISSGWWIDCGQIELPEILWEGST